MGDTSRLKAILDEERSRHPRMTERDVQKLVFQSVFGGDHALVDRARFAEGVNTEWGRLCDVDSRGRESILQTIDPEGRVARIHLAPCKAGGIDVEQLIDVIWHQPRRGGARRQFDRQWEDVVRLAAEGRIPFAADKLAQLGSPDDLPHHSPPYGATSYRILNDVSDSATRRQLERLGVLPRS